MIYTAETLAEQALFGKEFAELVVFKVEYSIGHLPAKNAVYAALVELSRAGWSEGYILQLLYDFTRGIMEADYRMRHNLEEPSDG